MESIVIMYRTASDEITRRLISKVRPVAPSKIDAFCHLRKEDRSFNLNNVLSAADGETGGIVGNIWRVCGAHRDFDGTEIIASQIAAALPAVRALKFFAQTTRGLGARERAHILDFIRTTVAETRPPDQALEGWLRDYWCGDAYAYRNGDATEYRWLLGAIPASLLKACRVTAAAIAAGSRRQLADSDLLQRIADDFSDRPLV
jgi:hypothetical protein